MRYYVYMLVNENKNKLFSYVDHCKNSDPNSCKKTLQLIKFLEHLKTDIDSISNINFNKKNFLLMQTIFHNRNTCVKGIKKMPDQIFKFFRCEFSCLNL